MLLAVVAVVAVFAVLALFAEAAKGTWPSEPSLMSLPVSVLFRMSMLRRLLFLTSLVVTLPLRMSLVRTELFLMSPESTLFLPGRVTAVPDRAASSATNATAIAGDGRRVRTLRMYYLRVEGGESCGPARDPPRLDPAKSTV